MEIRWADSSDMGKMVSLAKYYRNHCGPESTLGGFIEFCEDHKTFGYEWEEKYGS